ncbi:MAG: NAD(P)H-dependent oxidoreductase [Acidobacteria bacterium]|nr:NAD(P)H-dependent oxidoreductase [Acidobacteriota bacterium]
MNVLGIPGSLRRQSYNRMLLEVATRATPAGMSLTVVPVEILAAIPPFNEDLEEELDGDPEPVRLLRDAVRSADGILISTPEYNQSIPGVLKNHLDWLSRPRPDEVLAGKPAAIMGATSGEWGTRLSQSMARQVLSSTEAWVLPSTASIYIRKVSRLFDGHELRDQPTLDRLSSFLESFAEWIARCERPVIAG